jgi:hypothetical protein
VPGFRLAVRKLFPNIFKHTDVPGDCAYGDMNLGQREYRSYHHKVTEEVKEEDRTDTNGKPKYKMVEYDYEYATDFGTYESLQHSLLVFQRQDQEARSQIALARI